LPNISVKKSGIDYDLAYSPPLNVNSLKLIFTLSSAFHWNIFQLDIKVDYLNAPLNKNIYTTIENMLEKFNINNTRKRKTPCTEDNDISENKKSFNKTI